MVHQRPIEAEDVRQIAVVHVQIGLRTKEAAKLVCYASHQFLVFVVACLQLACEAAGHSLLTFNHLFAGEVVSSNPIMAGVGIQDRLGMVVSPSICQLIVLCY